MDSTKWARPHDVVSDLDLAFGVGVVERLMPPMAEIPEEFRYGLGKWSRVQSDWFFSGLSNPEWTPKEGIDKTVALRHLGAIQGSWDPKHEHKAAAVAYLMSLWFDDVTYDKKAATR